MSDDNHPLVAWLVPLCFLSFGIGMYVGKPKNDGPKIGSYAVAAYDENTAYVLDTKTGQLVRYSSKDGKRIIEDLSLTSEFDDKLSAIIDKLGGTKTNPPKP